MSPQREHQEHLRRPDPDALYLGEMRHNLVVRHVRQLPEDNRTFAGVLCQFADIAGFGCGQAQLPHAFRAEFHNAVGRKIAPTHSFFETPENNTCNLAAQLLIHNRPRQVFKAWLAVFDGIGADVCNDLRQHRVFFEMLKSDTQQLSPGARHETKQRLFDYMRNLRLPFAIALALPCFLLQAPAQQPPKPEPKIEEDLGDPIKVDVDVVSLYCAVRNKQNGLINNLDKGDFDLMEDGKQQTIRYFSRETGIPLTIGLLVDVSGSQQNLIEVERRAASAFFTSVLKQKDVAFLISFGADSELLQDITGTPRLLQDGLRRLRLNAGVSGLHSGPVPTMSKQRGTVMYDAVYLAANDMLSKEVGRKAIILITDGDDQGSSLTEKAAIEAAQKSDAIIYSILYVDRQGYGAFGGAYSGSGVLRHMSEETGGHMFEVDRKNSLENIFQQIQEEMRTQYLIGYTPTNPKKDGSYRKVDLRTKSKEQKVQVRKGYYAMPNNN